jgi:hypothetical protein
MKTFDQFIVEAELDDIAADKEQEQEIKAKGKPKDHYMVTRAFKNAMSALSRGDVERHRLWMRRAYNRLTGKQEE